MLRTFNDIEAALWFFCSLCIMIWMAKNKKWNSRGFILAATFILFGFSDIYETDAWWTPWWLLLWKTGCVFVFICIGVEYMRRKKTSDNK